MRSKERRELIRENQQPANKRRKTGETTYKRVLRIDNEGEKRRQEEEKEVEIAKRRRKETENNALPEGLEYEGGRKKTDDEVAEEWRERLREREEKWNRKKQKGRGVLKRQKGCKKDGN